jgi:hypothetical protein
MPSYIHIENISVGYSLSVICLSSAIRPDDDLIRQVTDEVVSDPQILDARSALFNAEVHFRHFIRRYGKKYSGPEEHEHRFGVFKSNLLRALEHQKLDPRASHGVTKFSDLTQEERSSRRPRCPDFSHQRSAGGLRLEREGSRDGGQESRIVRFLLGFQHNRGAGGREFPEDRRAGEPERATIGGL